MLSPRSRRCVENCALVSSAAKGIGKQLVVFPGADIAAAEAVGLGVVAGAELNAALAEVEPTALKGEIYTGPFKDELEVEEPQPGEDTELEMAKGGAQL